jgi:hypothetical protein
MESYPNKGMKFEQVRSRIKKYDLINRFGNTNTLNSLINQARRHEGEGAAQELMKEYKSFNEHSNAGKSLSGRGAKQVGWNEPSHDYSGFESLGNGRYRKVYE